jgi:hypothetical protein
MANDQENSRGRRRGRQTKRQAARAPEARGADEPAEDVAVPGEREQEPREEPQAVAEQQRPNTSSEGTPPPGGQEPPVTEKPVATRRKISQYVVSVDDATGSIVKIEKLDERTGERRELTPEEAAAACCAASYGAPYYAGYTTLLYDSLSVPSVQVYLKTISDYVKAFTGER